jgi:hypothetical protein
VEKLDLEAVGLKTRVFLRVPDSADQLFFIQLLIFMSAFKTAVQGILLGSIIGGSAYGAMRKQAQHAQDQLVDSVRVIQEDFKNPTASSIHQKVRFDLVQA